MEKMIEKLGLYDIWTMIFPGMIFICGLNTIHEYIIELLKNTCDVNKVENVRFNLLKIYYPVDIGEIIIFVLISYLFGHVLHELSSIVKNIVYRKGKPTELLLELNGKVLSDQEIQTYMPMFIRLNSSPKFSSDCALQRRNKSKIIFNKMNTELQSRNISQKYVKLNLIYNTCLTICVAILLLQLYALLYCIIIFIRNQHILIDGLIRILVALIPIFYLLFHRSKRYYIYWIKSIVAAYANLYEKEIAKDEK